MVGMAEQKAVKAAKQAARSEDRMLEVDVSVLLRSKTKDLKLWVVLVRVDNFDGLRSNTVASQRTARNRDVVDVRGTGAVRNAAISMCFDCVQ